jgi:hypothetical protein
MGSVLTSCYFVKAIKHNYTMAAIELTLKPFRRLSLCEPYESSAYEIWQANVGLVRNRCYMFS